MCGTRVAPARFMNGGNPWNINALGRQPHDAWRAWGHRFESCTVHHIKTLKPQWFQGFSLSQKQCLALFLALRHKKTRTSAGTDPLKTKIVFMLCYQYSRIGRENQSQGFILPAEFECTAPFGRRWPSSSDLSHAHTRPGWTLPSHGRGFPEPFWYRRHFW